MSNKIFVSPLRAVATVMAALAYSVLSSQAVDYLDVAEFAGKEPGSARAFASIVSSENGLAYDVIASHGALPIILQEDGTRFEGFNARPNDKLKGYAFALTPKIARAVSKRGSVRAAKGDLPLEEIASRRKATFAGVMFDQTPYFSAPDRKLWPRVTLKGAAPKTTKLAKGKEDRPRRKLDVAKKQSAPLDLIPEAALALIKTDAEPHAYKDARTYPVNTLTDFAERQIGYTAEAGRNVDDPKAIFEAVLSDQGGLHGDKAEKHKIARSSVKRKRSGLFRPKVHAAPNPEQKARRNKLHFWAGFRLPGSIYRKNQQRCLAAAIYFEARGEVDRGQAAVAQVVLNRVKAPAYPDTICGVVYHNKHLRNRCQFSFACDGIYDRVNDKNSWQRAVQIARKVSKGELYLPEVADSTHYHATYVKPNWGRSMRILTQIGIHIFYRTNHGGWS